MKYFKGKLHYYSATAEEPDHFYCWLGKAKEKHRWEKHLTINEGDIVETYKDQKKIIILGFPSSMAELKKILSAEDGGWDDWVAAVDEHWDIEVVQIFEKETLN